MLISTAENLWQRGEKRDTGSLQYTVPAKRLVANMVFDLLPCRMITEMV
jgi:hypothetical protein